MVCVRFIICAVFLFFFFAIRAQHPTYELIPTFTGFSNPVDLVNAGDGTGRLFVVEQDGKIKIIKNGSTLSTPFLHIDSLVRSIQSEQGLLGLAFHPEYVTNGHFFINYTDVNGDTQISRYTRDASNPDLADVHSKKLILKIVQPDVNHNGGCLRFGPDGYLYIATGDGGGGGDPSNYAQNKQSLLGKMLRIDINTAAAYGIPSNNPFVSDATTLNEIWALGLRNPWRFSFDRQTGDLWIGDVGQSNKEEIDFQPAASMGGENYGWRCYEGNDEYNLSGCSAQYTGPVFDYGRSGSTGGWSATGGLVYRGPNSCLNGYYFFADYGSGNFWTMASDFSTNRFKPNNAGSIAAFGEAEDGTLYAVSRSGTIFLIEGTTLEVSGNPISGSYYEHSGVISSDGRVGNGTTVEFVAGGGILLNPNFSVDQGATFNGLLGCLE